MRPSGSTTTTSSAPIQRWQNVGGAHGSLGDDGYLSVPNLGAYSQVEWQAARTAGVTLGLRYDRVTYRFESYMSGGHPGAGEDIRPGLAPTVRR